MQKRKKTNWLVNIEKIHKKPTPSSVKMSLNQDITMEKFYFDKAALSTSKRSCKEFFSWLIKISNKVFSLKWF